MLETRLQGIGRYLLPLSLVIAIVAIPAVLIVGTEREKIVVTVAAVLLLVLTIPCLAKPKKATTASSRFIPRNIVNVLEFAFLALALFSTLYSESQARSLVFFASIALFYAFLLIEVWHYPASRLGFLLKLTAAQIIFIESFAALYPAIPGIDSYRDLSIASYILSNGGGLPRSFTDVIWYNFSPLAPISYASGSLLTIAPLAYVELGFGFAFAFVPVLATGVIADQILKDRRFALVAMWFASLVPFLWEWATWPIPEIMAISLAYVVLVTVFLKWTPATAFVAIVALAGIILTHGGVSIELLIILAIALVAARKNWLMRITALGTVGFISYSTLAYVLSTPSGLATLGSFLDAVFVRSSSGPVATMALASGISGVVQEIALDYWWIFLVVLCWFALLGMRKLPFRKTRLVAVIFGAALFSIGAGDLFLVSGTSTDTFRYLAIFAYPLLGIFATIGIMSMPRSNWKSVVVSLLVGLFIVLSVTNVAVSPDFWQHTGQTQSASSFRLGATTTLQEQYSQFYLDSNDHAYYAVTNIFPEFLNLTLVKPQTAVPFISVYETNYNQIGLVPFSESVRTPYVVLYSTRAYQLNFSLGFNPLSAVNPSYTNVIYTNGAAYDLLVLQNVTV